MKRRLMQQAAEAKQKEEQAKKEALAAAGEDKLFKLQEELLSVDDLTADLDSTLRLAKKEPTAEETTPQPEQKFKWQTSLDSAFKFDFSQAAPVKDLSSIGWEEKIRGVERSEAGAEGVFFVDSGNTGVFVIKASRSMASECFASLLATRLGIYGPQWRIVTLKTAEGQMMVDTLKEKDPSGRAAISISNQAHVLLKNFAIGTDLTKIDFDRAAQIFGKSGLSDNGRKRLQEIGAVMLLDVLCNNGDRLPLIWDNRGNPGNIMFALGLGKIISLDNQIAPIDKSLHTDAFAEYLAKAKELVKSTVACSTATPPSESNFFVSVRSKINEFTTYDIGAAGTRELQIGFLNALKTANLTGPELENWHALLAEYSPTLVGLPNADPHFIMAVWNAMQEAL
eukprot:m.197774 g.197774  ORF g.197774 m.197774 type:complete len:396 (+) comp25882_c0_seq8:43-1230(+)